MELSAAMEDAIVLYPTPAIGHLISMVELGKFILSQKPSLSIHILIISMPYETGSTAPYIDSISATFPSIKFHHLPAITLPPTVTAAANHETLMFETIRLSNSNVHQALLSISKSHNLQALVMDFFCNAALSVAAQLNIPGYYYFASGAGCLAIFFYFPSIHENTTKSFKDLNAYLEIPGVPPIFSSDMPKPMLDRDDAAYQFFLEGAKGFRRLSGVIVNTFEVLEERSVRALRDGLCMPHFPSPPVYPVGPLISRGDDRGVANREVSTPACLTWLDSQPKRSVVFLCFGSLGLFSKEQLNEIAVGLERSGQRFLWVVRNPPSNNQTLAVSDRPDPDLGSLLPGGFLERTKERGFVIKSWAPQMAILNHESVGGFVTHCGWNSTLEAVCAGVPMVAWPLYAEQRVNRVLMVEEIKIALPMEESEDGFVSAAEVEKRVRELMESEEGKEIRERTVAMKQAAEAAMSEGGSSRVALTKVLESWKLQ